MARDHGRVMAAIWNDPEFVAMPRGPQWLFMFLLSQADLSRAGVLALRLRRWASRAAELSGDDLEADLLELAERRFVVVDHNTEEVLIRTFIRHDGVWKQPNVMKAAVSDAREVMSPLLRNALADELRRLPLDVLSDSPGKGSESPRTIVATCVETLLGDLAVTLPETFPGTLPETPPVRARACGPSPSPSPTPYPLEETCSPAPPVSVRDPIPAEFAEWWDTYPRKIGKTKAFAAYRKARKSASAEAILAGLRRQVDYLTRDPQYTPYPASWLNAGRWDDEVQPARRPPQTASTTDQRVQAGLDLAAQYRAAEEAEQHRAIGASQ